MTNDELRRAMASLGDARLARRAEIDAAARPPVSAADRIAAPFRDGDRVLDLRTGREGAVTYVGPADRSAAVVVSVRFADGSEATRGAADLLARPTPPAGRS